ncbi:hypothetical protein FKM82_005061 [Ascaphus truei]
MTARRPYYSCACFYTQNIYIDQYPMHVLHRRGCKTPEQFANVLEKVEKEVDRRMKLGAESLQRRAAISRNYKPLHPEVFVLQESFLAAEFLEAVRFCGLPEASLESLLNRVHSIPGKRIHRLPIFLPEFCRALVEELENFERSDVPKGRPNTMNNYGVLCGSRSQRCRISVSKANLKRTKHLIFLLHMSASRQTLPRYLWLPCF